MKAAYLAYDKNSLAALKVLANYFEQIDFFLVEPERPAEQIHFDEVSLMADTLMIPLQDEFRTETQQKKFQSLAKEFSFYKGQLLTNTTKGPNDDTEVQKTALSSVSSIEVIKDIAFNAKTNEVFVEKAKTGITAYHYLFVENHQIVSEQFGSFAKNIFKSAPLNTHVWFTVEFEYELKKPRVKDLGLKKFVLIKDSLSRSVLDNWYFVRTSENKMIVQQWLPFNQVKNSDFQKFIIERAEKLLREKLDLLHPTRLRQMYVNATPGFSEKPAQLRHQKISSLMPSFNFTPADSLNQLLYARLDVKMKELNKFQMTKNLTRG